MPPEPRASSYLGAPPPDHAQLADFPAYTLPNGATLHRVHRAALGAWFFSTDEGCRFTPAGLPDTGACYFAEQPVGALLEGLRGERSRLIPHDEVLIRRMFTVRMSRPLKLADLCDPGAGDFSVNGEIHTTTDYDKTQAWSAALHDAGFEGLRHLGRSDPGLTQVGVAIFSAAGSAVAGAWPAGVDDPIADELIVEAAKYGLKILPTP